MIELPVSAVEPNCRLLNDLHLNSIAVGQLVVEQDKVDAFARALQCFRRGFGFQDSIALILEPTRERPANQRLIIHDQHSQRRGFNSHIHVPDRGFSVSGGRPIQCDFARSRTNLPAHANNRAITTPPWLRQGAVGI